VFSFTAINIASILSVCIRGCNPWPPACVMRSAATFINYIYIYTCTHTHIIYSMHTAIERISYSSMFISARAIR
jgi:hypothetical protein